MNLWLGIVATVLVGGSILVLALTALTEFVATPIGGPITAIGLPTIGVVIVLVLRSRAVRRLRSDPARIAASASGGRTPRRKRIPGTGRLARAIFIPVWCFVLVCVLDGAVSQSDGFAMMAVPLCLAGIARAAMLGIWVDDHALIARSWIVTHRLRRSDLDRAETAPYAPLAYEGGVSRITRVVVLIRRDGVEHEVASSVSGRGRARTTAALINAWLGRRPTEPGPRAQRRVAEAEQRAAQERATAEAAERAPETEATPPAVE